MPGYGEGAKGGWEWRMEDLIVPSTVHYVELLNGVVSGALGSGLCGGLV